MRALVICGSQNSLYESKAGNQFSTSIVCFQGNFTPRFGLIYTSMGLYDLGIQNFERALPLVRESTGTEQSLQAEASLLQNIGAAYNEKALFLEAMVYHKEAVAYSR